VVYLSLCFPPTRFTVGRTPSMLLFVHIYQLLGEEEASVRLILPVSLLG